MSQELAAETTLEISESSMKEVRFTFNSNTFETQINERIKKWRSNYCLNICEYLFKCHKWPYDKITRTQQFRFCFHWHVRGCETEMFLCMSYVNYTSDPIINSNTEQWHRSPFAVFLQERGRLNTDYCVTVSCSLFCFKQCLILSSTDKTYHTHFAHAGYRENLLIW